MNNVINTDKASNKSSLKWVSNAITHVGKVRTHNEDSVLDRGEIGLWVVADGMGGHEAGDVASNMITSELKKVHEGLTLERFVEDIEDRLLKINAKLLQKSRESRNKSTIGSTVAIMVAYQNYCVYIWAGDSRLYRLRDKTLRQITTDHSQVEIYVEQGLISREEAAVHPHGNMITRAVGAVDDLYVDMDIQEMQPGDRYLLCSDGLNKHLSDGNIEDVLNEHDTVESACNILIEMTLDKGAGDNVTAIVIDIES